MAEDGPPPKAVMFHPAFALFPAGRLSRPIVPPTAPDPGSIRGARGPERGGPTRSHPEPGRDPPQRRRVLWGRPTGGEAAASPPDASGSGAV